MADAVNIFWFRRDLRLSDNAGLYHALRAGLPVLPVFIFDVDILDRLPRREDPRVEFICAALDDLRRVLPLAIFHGRPVEVFRRILDRFTVASVFANEDYEPYARERDAAVAALLAPGAFRTYKDQVVFSKDEVLKEDGKPYTVFTPYSRKWRALLTDFQLRPYPVEKYQANFYAGAASPMPDLASLGFQPAGNTFPPRSLSASLLTGYAGNRDFPGVAGTTRLGVHLRFGTVSIRKLAGYARALSETFLNELIWRDFFHMILWHFPHVGGGRAFRPEYDRISWRNVASEFERWCSGHTGYPLVDAGMRELNATGFMHNRVRMVTAGFLVKHLLVDWRWGEAYFAEKLLDFDLAANNGNWQWAAGCGCDAAPYFRIFNPTLQARRFDKDQAYVRRWVPELGTGAYPPPMVGHEFARKRCMDVYGKALTLK